MTLLLRNLVLLLVVAVTAPGCVAIDDYCYHHKKRALARHAWKATRQEDGLACRDYASGWKSAYYEMATGSNGALPAVAPQQYWATKYQNPLGQAAIESFFLGYQDGVLAAVQDGVGLWNGVPTSGVAALACQEPVWDGLPMPFTERMPFTEPLPFTEEVLPESLKQFDGAILEPPIDLGASPPQSIRPTFQPQNKLLTAAKSLVAEDNVDTASGYWDRDRTDGPQHLPAAALMATRVAFTQPVLFSLEVQADASKAVSATPEVVSEETESIPAPKQVTATEAVATKSSVPGPPRQDVKSASTGSSVPEKAENSDRGDEPDSLQRWLETYLPGNSSETVKAPCRKQ